MLIDLFEDVSEHIENTQRMIKLHSKEFNTEDKQILLHRIKTVNKLKDVETELIELKDYLGDILWAKKT